MLPLIMVLANAILKEEEVEVKPGRKNLTLEYVGKPIKINLVVLLDTRAQVSCIRQTVFGQLGLPMSILKKLDIKITAVNGTLLKNLGTVE